MRSQMYLISIDRHIDDTNQQLFSSLMKRCYVLTHDFKLQNIRLRISFNVWRDACVNSGLLSRHTLQHQTRSAHDDARSFFLLNHHILKYSKKSSFFFFLFFLSIFHHFLRIFGLPSFMFLCPVELLIDLLTQTSKFLILEISKRCTLCILITL